MRGALGIRASASRDSLQRAGSGSRKSIDYPDHTAINYCDHAQIRFRRQPRPAQVRLEVGTFLKCARPSGAKCWQRSRVQRRRGPSEKELIDLSRVVDPKGQNVEAWLMMLEDEMRASIRDIMKLAIADYLDCSRIQWM